MRVYDATLNSIYIYVYAMAMQSSYNILITIIPINPNTMAGAQTVGHR
jgi:hypothetical protein